MLPDFNSFRQQSKEINQDHSPEQASSKRSSQSKGFDKPAKKRDRTHRPKKKKKPKRASQYIVEALNGFLGLWNHRFDYIFAPHPDPDTKPDWQTETRYPLPDRSIEQGAYLYGVRPGPATTYALIDLDRNSPYHPQQDPLALGRINKALEPLGLVANVILTSSGSLGLHIYYPCPKELPSWQLGLVITTLLENKGFKVIPGWLEVFPNRKPYAADGNYSLFQAHRLPLQQGSYLLNDDLQPILSSEDMFVRQWHHAAARNDISMDVLKRTIRQAQRKAYKVTVKARKFLNDLDAEIELGWTGPGQTNRLMGRIAMRSYIFGHILGAEAPLTGKALADDIARVARALPGFKEYCRHQKTLDRKARDYARSIENKARYYPYASGKAIEVKEGPTENQRRAAEAREHIRQATIELFIQGNLPEKATHRFKLLCAYRISGHTLYKNQDLWHPAQISEEQKQFMERLRKETKDLHLREGATCAVGAVAPSLGTSLLEPSVCNVPSDKASTDPIEPENVQKHAIACNVPPDKAFSSEQEEQSPPEVEGTPPPEQMSLNVQWALQVAQSKQREQVEKNRQQYQKDKRLRNQAKHMEQLREWVDSGDPILVAEAERRLSRMAVPPQNSE